MAESSLTHRLPRWRRAALTTLALVFAAITLLYCALWMSTFYSRQPPVELGYAYDFRATDRALLISGVARNSPAERAGLRPGDRIIAVNGARVQKEDPTNVVWYRSKPGDSVELTIERPGNASPLVLTGVFRKRTPGRGTPAFAVQILYPVPFVLVGLAVLFLRIEDPQVWLLALLFGSFPATQGFPSGLNGLPDAVRPLVLGYQSLLLSVFGPLFYFFFTVFPVRSPLDRRLPWLKWAAIPVGLSLAFPGTPGSGLSAPPPFPALLGQTVARRIPLFIILGLIALGLIALAGNFFATRDLQTRRKIRVVFWGMAVGILPSAIEATIVNFSNFHTPPWLRAGIVLIAFVIPLSFAYAVIKHRVLDIPVLLKRSARYVLVQRGFTLLLFALSVALMSAFAQLFPQHLQGLTDFAGPSGIALGAVFGVGLFWSGSRVHRKVSGTIDRAFFRSSYDARVVLEDLAEKTRTTSSREELAHLLDRHLSQALHPNFLVVYLNNGAGYLTAGAGAAPPGFETLPSGGHALDSRLAPLQPDFVAPVPARDGSLAGLLLLGPRRSEEPYSGEDKRLLSSVISQAGTALDNIRLAEQIAEKIEAERRTAHEMEIAKQVQLRLLPQRAPDLKTLDCAARCIEARSVGGDYYDFLDLGEERFGFVLADVSGKGVHAALLVANLQAHLRSYAATMAHDPARILERVNRMLWTSTAAQHYATLFFGIYNDSTRELSYANCGHNPPMLLRHSGALERLEATATVVGLFEQWECSVGQVCLAPGDLLAVFSDGVTEAMREDEEFGEARLLEALHAHAGSPVSEMVSTILTTVEEFSAGVLSDDLTLLIARARPLH